MRYEARKKHSLQELLRMPDKGVSLASNPLAILVRDIFRVRNMTISRFNVLLGYYLDQEFSTHDKRRSSTRSNILREVAKDSEMTYKTVKRVFLICQIEEVTSTYELKFADGRVTYHQTVQKTGIGKSDHDQVIEREANMQG